MGLDFQTTGRPEFTLYRDAWNRAHGDETVRPPADAKRLKRMMTVH